MAGVLAVGAAPAAPVIIGFLDAVALFVLALALAFLWFKVLRPPLWHLGSVGVGFVHPFRFLHDMCLAVDGWVTSTEAGAESAVVWSLHTLMHTFTWLAKGTEDLARAVWTHNTHTDHQAKAVRNAVYGGIEPRLKTLEKKYTGIEGNFHHRDAREQAQKAAGAAAGAIDTKTFNHAVKGINDRIGKLEKEYQGIEHGQTATGTRVKTRPGETATKTRARAVPRTKTPTNHWTDIFTRAALGSLGIAILSRLGLGWVRCPNMGRLGRFLCNLDKVLMDALMAGLAIFVASEGIVKFAEEMQGIIVEGEHLVAKFWKASDIGHNTDRHLGEVSAFEPPT